jgi:hypothetical protein
MGIPHGVVGTSQQSVKAIKLNSSEVGNWQLVMVIQDLVVVWQQL